MGEYPGGVNADEAYAGYEAWSLFHYGMDSWGYSMPVYFTVWGSGMSILNSYLMIPFIAAGGLNPVTVRIPQMLFGVLTVWLLYGMVKRAADQRTALWAAFLLAVSPWHIMTTRYGMDANLAPALIMLGAYFGVRGLESGKYLIVSALFWGLSLYAYATIWTFVPVFLAGGIGYCLYTRRLKISGWLTAACVILFLIALPLLLFVAVNTGIMPEIRTTLISIPKLVCFRADEMNIKKLPENMLHALKLFITQNDHNIWNSIPYFGVGYLFSTPFLLVGMAKIVKTIWNSIREKSFTSFSYDVLLLWWVVTAAASAVLQRTNLNRINAIHLAMFIVLAKGIVCFCTKMRYPLQYGILALYSISFLVFEGYYFTAYQDIISERQLAGAGQALACADKFYETKKYDAIHVTAQLRHSHVLFYTQYPTDRYIEEVQWKNYPNKYLVARSFGNYYWDDEEEVLDERGVYVIVREEFEEFEHAGYEILPFSYCGVAYKH